jgi:uncharacterized repeat protein (TIGR02543 family)
MKKHTLFLTGIPGLMLVFGLFVYTGGSSSSAMEHPASWPSIHDAGYAAKGGEFAGSGGWDTNEDGMGTSYAADGFFTFTGDGSFTINSGRHVQWTKLPWYTVSYDANGGESAAPLPHYAQSGSTITLKNGGAGKDKLTRFGYTFRGWNTAADGTGKAWAAEAPFPVTGDLTLYAHWTETEELSDRVYVGVVAFNDKTSEYALSNNLGRAKRFIHAKDNDVDSTALCYGISKAVTLFGAADLPVLDNLFIVSFTDGIDNSSSGLYTGVAQAQVYDRANSDLSNIPGMKSYAIGFGAEPNEANMKKLVINKGQYRTVSAENMDQVFQDIAYSVLGSSKNIELVTQNGTYTERYPKYFKITVTVKGGATHTASIKCALVGTTFSIIERDPGSYVSFDAPAAAVVTGSKMRIPLRNLTYARDGTEWYISAVEVQVSYDNIVYRKDVEDGSALINGDTKKTGVVLVLDCSKSLGSAFESVKTAAYNFIDTLRSTDTQ